MLKSRPAHLIQHERRSPVLPHESNLHVGDVDSLRVTDEEPVSRQHPEHRGLGILLLPFGRLKSFARGHATLSPEEERVDQIRWLFRDLIQIESAAIPEVNIAELDVFNIVVQKAA